VRWIRQVVQRYHPGGLTGLRDRRHQHRGQLRLPAPEQKTELRRTLLEEDRMNHRAHSGHGERTDEEGSGCAGAAPILVSSQMRPYRLGAVSRVRQGQTLAWVPPGCRRPLGLRCAAVERRPVEGRDAPRLDGEDVDAVARVGEADGSGVLVGEHDMGRQVAQRVVGVLGELHAG
jgi:hypothetical protein